MDESNLFFRNLVCLLRRETEHNTTQKILNTRQKLTPTNEKNSNVSVYRKNFITSTSPVIQKQ